MHGAVKKCCDVGVVRVCVDVVGGVTVACDIAV